MKIKIVAYHDDYHDQVRDLQLKEPDKQEVEDANGLPYRATIGFTLENYNSSMYVILYEDTVSGIFGVVPTRIEGEGVGYLLTDDRLQYYKKDVAQYSEDVLISLLENYDIIMNYVSSKHTVSVRWLKRLGAHFDKKTYLLSNREVPFFKFEFRKEDYYDKQNERA
jgi:hypothetical protein